MQSSYNPFLFLVNGEVKNTCYFVVVVKYNYTFTILIMELKLYKNLDNTQFIK